MQQIGRYQIVERIGRGAMGVVYRALDPKIGRTVAVKSIRLGEISDTSELKRLRDRLEREARSAGALSHPNIVTIYDILEEEKLIHLFMEYVNGPSLEKMLNEHRLPSKELVLNFFRQVASALDYAHRVGIVHRDVKPSNLMLNFDKATGEQLAKITDFGVAKFVSQQMTQAGSMMGTPNYMAPEQIEGGAISGETDQFALAAVAYELLTGRKPFSADYLPTLFFRIVRENPPAADQVNTTLSREINSVLQRGLAKSPKDRFENCSVFVAALVRACEAHADWSPPYRMGIVNFPSTEENRNEAMPPFSGSRSFAANEQGLPTAEPRREKEAVPPVLPFSPASSPEEETTERSPFHIPPAVPQPDFPEAAAPGYELPTGQNWEWDEKPATGLPLWRKAAIAAILGVLAYVVFAIYQNYFGSGAAAETAQGNSASHPAITQPTTTQPATMPPAPDASKNTPEMPAPAEATPNRPSPYGGKSEARDNEGNNPIPKTLPGSAANQQFPEHVPGISKHTPETLMEVQFTSDPAQGRVVVDRDETKSCLTPCAISLSPGRHTLTVSAPNYGLARRIIQIPEQRNVFVPLSQEIGIVQLDSVPSGSKIFVDGREIGQTPTTLKLLAGPHQIRLLNGTKSHQETIEVNADGLQQFTFRWQ